MNFTVLYPTAIVIFGVLLRLADALYTKRALFHHSFFSYRYIRIELLIERRVPVMIVIVEISDFIRAVNSA